MSLSLFLISIAKAAVPIGDGRNKSGLRLRPLRGLRAALARAPAAAAGALALSLVGAPLARADVDPDEANQVLSTVDTDLARIKTDLDTVARGYAEAAMRGAGQGRVERRLREGEILFLLNDYLRASIVLLDVVDDERARTHPRYDDCVFLLAESLRKTENWSGARAYYEQILPRTSGDRLKDTVIALLEIASRTSKYDNVQSYIDRLTAAGGLSRPDVDYIHGKMLFQIAEGDRAKLERAHQAFKSVPIGTGVSAQASYYAGVVLVSLGRYPDAIAEFTETLRRVPSTPDGRILSDLAHLSLARLYQETNDIPKAVAEYQQLARTSPYFTDMLFEVAWAHVRAANAAEKAEDRQAALSRALRMAELLMASNPDARMFPEARILEGNLQIRLDAPETAYDTFQSIIDRYGGARSKLAELIASNPDPKQFFDQLIAADRKTFGNTGFLPPLVVEWAIRTPEMKRAVRVMEDLRASEAFATEAQELLKTLNEALAGEQRYNMFRGLSPSRKRAFSVENKLVVISQRLLSLERKMTVSYLTAAEQAQIEQQQAKRQALEAEVQALPQTMEQVEEEAARINGAYKDVDRRVFRQGYAVEGMKAQIAAVEVWLNSNRESLSPEQIELMNKRLLEARTEVGAVEEKVKSLSAEIRTAAAISGGDAGRAHALALREKYLESIANEAAMLRSMRSKLPPDLQGVTARIDQQRDAVSRMGDELKGYQQTLDQQVEAKVADIREQLELEAGRLGKYDGEKLALRGETDTMLGPFATTTLKRVEEDFKDLVLKADVGIIDVAWERKQSSTRKVGELVRALQERTRELETEFADVLEGN